jgi:endonuclease G, mitochondrial
MRSSFNRRNLWVLVLLVGLFVWWVYTSNQSPSFTPAPPPTARTAAIRPTTRTAAPAPPTARAAARSPATRTAPGGNRNLLLGNPSDAVHDPSQPANYLIERPQYVLSYNRDHGIPNWVSWQVTKRDLGDTKRSNNFVPDTTLPKGWFRVTLDDYTGTGYDRGHMCPSADRTATEKDNQATFILTNVLPQAPDNNRGTWEHLESFSRQLVSKGHVLYIIAGGDSSNGTIAKGKILVPRYTWKIIVVMPKGESDVAQITADTPVIAVRVPNAPGKKLDDWDQYRVSVASIEAATGYHFFTNLAPDIQDALKSRVDPVPTN